MNQEHRHRRTVFAGIGHLALFEIGRVKLQVRLEEGAAFARLNVVLEDGVGVGEGGEAVVQFRLILFPAEATGVAKARELNFFLVFAIKAHLVPTVRRFFKVVGEEVAAAGVNARQEVLTFGDDLRPVFFSGLVKVDLHQAVVRCVHVGHDPEVIAFVVDHAALLRCFGEERNWLFTGQVLAVQG